MVELDEAFRNILDCFSGEDGGVKFTRFHAWVKQLDKKTDPASQELKTLVIRFSKLIDIVSLR